MPRLKSLASWENITLLSLVVGIPVVVYSLTRWEFALMTMIAINACIYYLANRGAK